MLVVLCTFPNVEDAGAVAHTLVAEGLCACVNILPYIRSIYKWQGEIANSAETLCLIKTSKDVFPALAERLRDLHSYEVPEIVALAPEQVSASYLAWVLAETSKPQEAPPTPEGGNEGDSPAEAS